MSLRRIHLKTGVAPYIHEDDIGKDEPRLVLWGRTESGGSYEIVLTVNEWVLALLAERTKQHFVAQRARDDNRHQDRMSAFGGAS